MFNRSCLVEFYLTKFWAWHILPKVFLIDRWKLAWSIIALSFPIIIFGYSLPAVVYSKSTFIYCHRIFLILLSPALLYLIIQIFIHFRFIFLKKAIPTFKNSSCLLWRLITLILSPHWQKSTSVLILLHYSYWWNFHKYTYFLLLYKFSSHLSFTGLFAFLPSA